MKLRNKKTLEIRTAEARDDGIYLYDETTEKWYKFDLELLAKGWEYYEAPKEKWVIDIRDGAGYEPYLEEPSEMDYEIGNYFETEEQAEKAVEKLKAWKRLKDKGFKITGIMNEYINVGTLYDIQPLRTARNIGFNKSEDLEWLKDNKADIDLLFGGEE